MCVHRPSWASNPPWLARRSPAAFRRHRTGCPCCNFQRNQNKITIWIKIITHQSAHILALSFEIFKNEIVHVEGFGLDGAYQDRGGGHAVDGHVQPLHYNL